jgi:predicted TPR repeat methyltransferase
VVTFSWCFLCHLDPDSRIQQAKEDAERCVTLNPKWPKGHVRLAHANEHLGKLTEALLAIEAGREANPDDPGLRNEELRISGKCKEQNTREVDFDVERALDSYESLYGGIAEEGNCKMQ